MYHKLIGNDGSRFNIGMGSTTKKKTHLLKYLTCKQITSTAAKPAAMRHYFLLKTSVFTFSILFIVLLN